MLIYFSAENFKSIEKTLELNLRSNNRLRNHRDHVRYPMKNEKKIGVLKGAAIYGANAAGKSTIVEAIQEAINYIGGVYNPKRNLFQTPFKLCKSMQNKPTEFYFEFCIANVRHSYSFSYDNESIIEEELAIHSSERKFETAFKRKVENGKNIITSDLLPDDILSKEDQNFDELMTELKLIKGDDLIKFIKKSIEHRSIIERTPKDKLILSEVSTRNIDSDESFLFDVIKQVKFYLSNRINCISPNSKYLGIHEEVKHHSGKEHGFIETLKSFDTGISDIKVNKYLTKNFDKDFINEIEKELKTGVHSSIFKIIEGKYVIFSLNNDDEVASEIIKTIHLDRDGKEVLFDIEDESDGSQRLMDLLPIMSAQAADEHFPFTFIIDEFNQSLHPNLAVSFFTKFFELTSNNLNQLIATTHESALLNNKVLRRDEIFFVQKDDEGSTSLYGLDDYSVRYDKDIRNAYLSGKFGAVPDIN